MYKKWVEKFYEVRHLETDIVVVGGSGAAVSAAVASSGKGLKVLLVSKGRVGKSGNAIVSTANISMDGESAYAMGERRAQRDFTKDMLFEKIVKFSFYLADPRLVSYFVDECDKRVGEFIRVGKRMGEPFIFVPPSGWITTGRSVGKIISRMLKSASGIEALEDTVVIDVIFNNSEVGKRVAGVIALQVKTGRLFVISARAVIIASGGYQPYSFKCTTSDATGDGIAMAMRVGALVSDMEFQLFLPGVMRYPPHHRGSIFPFLWYVGGFVRPDIVNSGGESLVKKMDPHLFEISLNSKWFKLIHTYYWGKEIGLNGGDGDLFFDFKDVGRFRYTLSVIREKIMLKMLYGNPWVYQGEDFKDLHGMVKAGIPWAVGLASEYSMGGIVVDERLQSSVDGLFAAGESASGLFGAFRGENGLTEMLVMGYKAGSYAAEYAVGVGDVSVDEEFMEMSIGRLLLPFYRREEGENIFGLREKLERIADRSFGFLRDGEEIERGLKELEALYEKFGNVRFLKNSLKGYNPEFLEYLQLRNLATCLAAGLKSATVRKESRGMHIRKDFPRVRHDEWLKRITVSLWGMEPDLDMKVESLKTFSVNTLDTRGMYGEENRLSDLEPPDGSDRDILEYIKRKGV